MAASLPIIFKNKIHKIILTQFSEINYQTIIGANIFFFGFFLNNTLN